MPVLENCVLILANSRHALTNLPEASIDACVTDAPYELGFMGKTWDRTGIAFDAGFWRLVCRVLKPGAHLLACGGTRTYHRMGVAIEDAGFEIRDVVAWLYGSGFPKSLNLGDGLGTALKPAHEPIVLARKPFKGSVTATVAQYGTGALNVEACRIDSKDRVQAQGGSGGGYSGFGRTYLEGAGRVYSQVGRWPANVVVDDVAAMVIDEQSAAQGMHGSGSARDGSAAKVADSYAATSYELPKNRNMRRLGDDGFGSRFYYCAKPSREERDFGIYDLRAKSGGEATDRTDGSAGLNNPRAGAGRTGGARNFHPTVKPVELMRWLVRLVTPVNGVVLDPFMGSGTTGMAAKYEQRRFIGIEREPDYMQIAERRIAAVTPLFSAVVERQAEAAVDPQLRMVELTADHARETS